MSTAVVAIRIANPDKKIEEYNRIYQGLSPSYIGWSTVSTAVVAIGIANPDKKIEEYYITY